MSRYTKEILRIARFMNIVPIECYNSSNGTVYYTYNELVLQDYEALPTYDMWSELIPVVEKIESLGDAENEFFIVRNFVEIGGESFYGHDKKEAVIKAINWWLSKNFKEE